MDNPIIGTRIYKPLTDLKYHYQSHSQSSTIRAAASTELPHIKQKEHRRRDSYVTQNDLISNTIKDVLKMKLEYGHIHDQISLIDLHMQEESAKHENAVLMHDQFVVSFERFLSSQYKQVTDILFDVANHEHKSDKMREKLNGLRQLVVQKSLETHELECSWRQFKISQKFLVHVAFLLKSTDSLTSEIVQNFNVNPVSETPTLEELIENFGTHDDMQTFDEADFEHVTASRILDFLFKLKQQNLMLLRFNHEYKRTKDIFSGCKIIVERQLQEKESILVKNVTEIKKQIEGVSREMESVQSLYDKEVSISKSNARKAEELQDLVQSMYESCFGSTIIHKSSLQMMKCVEEHCLQLLCELNSFEPHILKKVL